MPLLRRPIRSATCWLAIVVASVATLPFEAAAQPTRKDAPLKTPTAPKKAPATKEPETKGGEAKPPPAGETGTPAPGTPGAPGTPTNPMTKPDVEHKGPPP